MNRDEIRGAELVAAPGCYPTAALLALAAAEGLAEDTFIDAKSGVSGAGREATETTHFVSVAENLTPYKVEGHRHQAELDAVLRPGAHVRAAPPADRPGADGQLLRPARAAS